MAEHQSSLPAATSRQAAAEHGLDAIDTDDSGSGLWLPLAHDDSIRLFTLTRDPASGLLAFSLSEHRLSQNPDYMAVSYVWGKLGNVAIIEASNGHRALRRNLHAVLHNLHLRMQRGELDPSTMFWIDALCINQESLEEKSQQVQQIGETFKQAKKVIVWLGTHPDGGRSCLEPIFGDVVLRPRWGRLSTHNYWTRVWIIQEFVLASDLVLMDEMHWISGLRLIDRLDNIPSDRDVQQGQDDKPFTTGSYEASLMGRIVYMRYRQQFYRAWGADLTSSVVARFREQSCSDLRDKIYALRSLSGSKIRVDYSISVADLFWYTVTHYENNRILQPLHQIHQVMQALGLLPCQLLSSLQLMRFKHRQHDEGSNIRPTSRNFDRTRVMLRFELDEFTEPRVAGDIATEGKFCHAGDIFRNDRHIEYLLVNGHLGVNDLILQSRVLPFGLILEKVAHNAEVERVQVCGITVQNHQSSPIADDLLKSIDLTRFDVFSLQTHGGYVEFRIYPNDLSLLFIMNEEISKKHSSCISLFRGEEIWEMI